MPDSADHAANLGRIVMDSGSVQFTQTQGPDGSFLIDGAVDRAANLSYFYFSHNNPVLAANNLPADIAPAFRGSEDSAVRSWWL